MAVKLSEIDRIRRERYKARAQFLRRDWASVIRRNKDSIKALREATTPVEAYEAIQNLEHHLSLMAKTVRSSMSILFYEEVDPPK